MQLFFIGDSIVLYTMMRATVDDDMTEYNVMDERSMKKKYHPRSSST